MKLPLTWLKDFISYRCSSEELARRLTLGGFEIEGQEQIQGDTVFEVNVTPNRGDGLSVLGIAREVSALLNLPLKQKKSLLKTTFKKVHPKIKISLKSSKKCPRYAMAILKDVRVGKSPEWMVKRLEQVGLRSINNVVDVTNYILMETGHPLHAFDLKKIRGGVVSVREAQSGEILQTLNGQKHELISSDLIIADAQGPIALAGVMGGKDSEIDFQTTDVALECAFFDPSTLRKTARRLGLQTDSSYRFERRVDPENQSSLMRALELLIEVTGGFLEGPVLELYPKKIPNVKISFNPEDVQETVGGIWKSSEIKKSLQRLSFGVKEKNKSHWDVLVPSWRGDVEIKEDLIEEVVRLGGLDRVPVTFPFLKASPAVGTEISQEKQVKDLLSHLGFHEAIHFSFVSPEDVSLLDPSLLERSVSLKNPLGQEYSLMSPSLLPSLLKTLSHHHRHKIFSVRLFELRKRFLKTQDSFMERRSLAGVLSGAKLSSHWSDADKEIDFFDVKGILQRVLGSFGLLHFDILKGKTNYLHPGKQALIRSGDKECGIFGEIHPEVAQKLDLKKSVFVFELDWEVLLESLKEKVVFQNFSQQPVVKRDLALLLDENISAGEVRDFIAQQDKSVWSVDVFDLYQGDKIPPGKKSVAFAIELGNVDQTMTEEEIVGIMHRIMENSQQKFKAEIR